MQESYTVWVENSDFGRYFSVYIVKFQGNKQSVARVNELGDLVFDSEMPEGERLHTPTFRFPVITNIMRELIAGLGQAGLLALPPVSQLDKSREEHLKDVRVSRDVAVDTQNKLLGLLSDLMRTEQQERKIIVLPQGAEFRGL